MTISPELLSKAAKVYEAAEAVEGMKPKEVFESHKKCAPGEFNMHKEGGWGTEVAGNIVNPLNWFGVAPMIGSGLAAMTPTRSLEDQARADKNTWKNILIPGRAAYNWWKRIGAGIRSPEMMAIKLRHAKERQAKRYPELEAEEAPKVQAKAAALAFGEKLARTLQTANSQR